MKNRLSKEEQEKFNKDLVQFVSSNDEADKILKSDPRAEKFAVASHSPDKHRLLTQRDGRWIPVGPEMTSVECCASKLKMISAMAGMSGMSMFSIFDKGDQMLKKDCIPMSSIPDDEWIRIVESQVNNKSIKVPKYGLSEMIPFSEHEKVNQYLKDRPGSEKISTVTHKSGKARWIGWINDKWTPIGPEHPSTQDSINHLKELALMVTKSGKTSLIHEIQEIDKMYLTSGLPLSDIPDSEWLPTFQEQQLPSELLSDQPQNVRINFGLN